MIGSCNCSALLARATGYVLMASLASVACGFVILALIIISRHDAKLKAEYPTWKSTLVALRKDCDRVSRGGEVFIIKHKQQRMITVQCNDEKGQRVLSYRLDWTGVDTNYSVSSVSRWLQIREELTSREGVLCPPRLTAYK